MLKSLILATTSLLFTLPLHGKDSVEAFYRSYLAHVSAANASLRLHETAEAKKWIAAAPAEHRGWEWHMLSERADQSASALSFEGLSTRRFHLRSDGSMLAAVLDDSVAVLVDTRARRIVRRISGHFRAIYGIRFSPEGTRIVTCGRDTTIRLWDAGTGALLRAFDGLGWPCVLS